MNKKSFFLKLILAVLPLTLISQNATAQFYFEEMFFPVFLSKNDALNVGGGGVSQNVNTETGLGFDTRTTLGYRFNTWLMVGLSYNYYTITSSRGVTDDSEGLTAKTTKNEWGPTVAFLSDFWSVGLTYFVSAEKSESEKFIDTITKDVATDETYNNTGGSGFQISVSYRFRFGTSMTLGPALIYRTVRYGKQSRTVRVGAGTPYGSTSLQTKAIDDELKPMILLSFQI